MFSSNKNADNAAMNEQISSIDSKLECLNYKKILILRKNHWQLKKLFLKFLTSLYILSNRRDFFIFSSFFIDCSFLKYLFRFFVLLNIFNIYINIEQNTY